jgi:MFS family permease
MFTAALGVILNLSLGQSAMGSWGWRIPFLVGCLIIPLLFLLRRDLPETEAFQKRSRTLSWSELARMALRNWGLVIVGTMMVTMTTVSFYLITAYTPTFGARELHLSPTAVLIVTLCVGFSNLVWLPVMGSVSDRIGRFPVLAVCTILALLTAYPLMHWLVGAPSFTRLLGVLLWLSFLYGSYNGAMVVALTEIMPEEVRTTGFSLAYSLATALFGGFTPAICEQLIHLTGNKAMPGVWLSAAALVGLAAILLVRPQLTGGRASALANVPAAQAPDATPSRSAPS